MVVPIWGVLPFALLLVCIATFPLIPATAKLWHRHWFQLLVALFFGLPMGLWMWLVGNQGAVVHAAVEYSQFIALLLSLFVVSGGIFVAGDIEATPRNNVIFLAVGGLLASFIGTTGAAMLMIRPLLNTNAERRHKTHTVVFAIFIIANCGGLLTPLGDPPLFLGMLRGVPFLWTMNLVLEWLFVNNLLLLSYYALDARMYASEALSAVSLDKTRVEPIGIHGKHNFLWLAVIILAVALVPSVDLEAVAQGHADSVDYIPFREMLMLSVAALSYVLGNKRTRFEANKFTWAPIIEVAALFSGIFLAMVPALAYLRQVAPSLPLDEVTFFLFTGGLSAVLDNAPTYATFFEMARELPGSERIGDVPGVPALYLRSISLAAVFFGAMTYIGNGPNFMVKSIAESTKIRMPSFGGYSLKWACRYLLPILAMMMLVFIVQDWRFQALGVALSFAWAGLDVWNLGRQRRTITTIIRT